MSHNSVETLTRMRNECRERSQEFPAHSPEGQRWQGAAHAYQIAVEALGGEMTAPDGCPTIDEMIAATEAYRKVWKGYFDPNVFLSMTAALNRLREVKRAMPVPS